MTITTGYVDVKAVDGGVFQAYLSKPAAADTSALPGLLLIQEVFGVNAHIRAVADDYAAQGFVVLAPDMFWRAEPNVELSYDMESAVRGMGLWRQISAEHLLADLQASVKSLETLCNGSVASVGYCMGGQLVYRLAATGAIKAGISYYGMSLGAIIDQAKHIAVPMLFHFGKLDKNIPQAEVEVVRTAFADHDNVAVYVYDDADHGFNCSQRASYNPGAARLARERSLSFLRSVL